MFRALKYLHDSDGDGALPRRDARAISRSGKPKHRVERLEHIVAWFDKYLEGQEIHTYDVQ